MSRLLPDASGSCARRFGAVGGSEMHRNHAHEVLLGPIWGGVAQGASIGSPKVPRVLHALFRSPVPLLWFIVNRTKRHNPINYSKDRPTKRVSGCVLARFPGSPVRRSKRFYCAVIPLQTRHSSQMDHINTCICPTPVQTFFSSMLRPLNLV